MWFLGHFSVAYLIAKGVSRERLPGYMIPLLLLFGNIPDCMHIGVFRLMTHNLAGTFLVTAAALFAIRFFVKLNRYELLLLFTAGMFHILGDFLYGSYHPFYPISTISPTLFDFNTAANVFTELVLGGAVFTIMIFTGDHRRFAVWCREVLLDTLAKRWSRDRTRKVRFPVLFILGFWFMTAVQILIILLLIYREGGVLDWFRWVLVLLFVFFLTLPLQGFVFYKNENGKNKVKVKMEKTV